MAGNHLSGVIAPTLASGLKYCPNLRLFDISDNPGLDDKGCLDFKDALREFLPHVTVTVGSTTFPKRQDPTETEAMKLEAKLKKTDADRERDKAYCDMNNYAEGAPLSLPSPRALEPLQEQAWSRGFLPPWQLAALDDDAPEAMDTSKNTGKEVRATNSVFDTQVTR